MSLFSKSFKAFLMVVATALLPMLASCQLITEDYDDEISDNSASRYINITVSVSASENPITRAYPNGGETGDGLEKGFDRENTVNYVTLIFYEDEDNAGINTTKDTKVAFFDTYSVTESTAAATNNGNAHNHDLDNENVGWTGTNAESDTNEVIYTTGDQPLEEDKLDVSKTYHAIVVANAPNALLANITAGVTTISAVREMVVATVFDGSEKGTEASNFVMASERDATITFTNRKTDTANNTITYYFECIHIERLAARIDFHTKYGGLKTVENGVTTSDNSQATWVNNIYKVNADDDDYLVGYDYKVFTDEIEADPSSTDHFLVVGLTPFNVANGNEFVIKRTDDTQNPYLHKETTSNWVLDPYSAAGKTEAAYPNHIGYHLEDLTTVAGVAGSNNHLALTNTENGCGQSYNNSDTDNKDNIIVGYVKENTIEKESPLYYYATGLAIEGYYFKDGATSGGEHMVLYTFIRHQGEATSSQPYDAFTFSFTHDTNRQKTLEQVKAMKCHETTAMNFGIVRNNIYRVSINRITKPTDETPKVTLLIKVKKWDKFVHAPIYM